MHKCKSSSSYPRNQERTGDFQNEFSWLMFKAVCLPVYKFFNGMIASGLNNGRSKTDVINMSTPPKEGYCILLVSLFAITSSRT